MSDDQIGKLPQSDALTEAGNAGESLAELLSRDPESYSTRDLDSIIDQMVRQSEAWAKAEAAAQETGKAPRVAGSIKAKLATSSGKSADEIGI